MSCSPPPTGPNAGLLRLWKLKNVLLCSSRYALEEARINLTDEVQQVRLTRLATRIHLFDALSSELPPKVALPDKDIPILLAAIAAKATHLITGDVRHFGPYFGKKIAGILVLLPADYLAKSTPGR
jgi:predicted nucleic acid-binding protein